MIRAYQNSDFNAVLDLFDLNVPNDFSEEERRAFITYLTHELEVYFVVEKTNIIIGAGGINFNFNDGKTARLSWGMIHPDFQRQGFGKELLEHRITFIHAQNKRTEIQVRTSQKAYKFYEKQGFEITEIKVDYWSKGFDLYDMFLKIKRVD